MSIWLLQMYALTALEHSLSITLSVGAYPWALRLARMYVNAEIMAPLVFGRRGADKDGIQIINVCDKHILHVAEGLHGEGTGAIGVHRPGM